MLFLVVEHSDGEKIKYYDVYGYENLTNEIKDDNYIEEFENYGYKLNNGQTSCKIKGFSVNFIASESLNFQSMRDLFLNRNSEETISLEQNKFII